MERTNEHQTKMYVSSFEVWSPALPSLSSSFRGCGGYGTWNFEIKCIDLFIINHPGEQKCWITTSCERIPSASSVHQVWPYLLQPQIFCEGWNSEVNHSLEGDLWNLIPEVKNFRYLRLSQPLTRGWISWIEGDKYVAGLEQRKGWGGNRTSGWVFAKECDLGAFEGSEEKTNGLTQPLLIVTTPS